MELSLDRVIGILGIVLAIVLIVLDKAEKLKGPILFWLLGLAAVMTLPLALGNSWLSDTPWGILKFSKGMFLVSVVMMAYSILAIWISPAAITNPLPEGHATAPPAERRIACRVSSVDLSSYYLFFQQPPRYFQRLDVAMRMNITNQLGRPFYLDGYSVAALVGTDWVQFKNPDRAEFDLYAFGVMGEREDASAFIRRLDLSENGFDYVMHQGPLNQDQSRELWMFFISGLTIQNLRNISQFRFTFRDSTGEEFSCTSPYSMKDDKRTAVGINAGDLKVLPPEPVPANLREEPAH